MNKFIKILPLFAVTAFYVLHYVCAECFVYQSLFYHYFLVITTCILLIYSSIRLLLNKKRSIRITTNILLIISLLFLFFPLIFEGITGKVEWYSSVRFICVFALVLLFSFLISNNYLPKSTVEKVIILFAGIESVICFLQIFGIFSQGKYFSISGSHANPNVTAMFLVLAFPLIIKQFVNSDKRTKILTTIVMLAILTAIVLLKSRTAYIGLCIVIVTLSTYYIAQKSKILVLFFFLLIIAAALGISPKLSNFKQNSADGRLFVWKVTAKMIDQKPLGYGYGMVQGEYNKAQAHFFADNQTTEVEKQNAFYMHSVMNDYLEMSVQGGIVGGIMYLLFIILSIHYGFKNLKNNLYYFCGILSFALMGLTNYAFNSVFAVMVFAYYVVAVINNLSKQKTLTIYTSAIYTLSIVSIVITVFFIIQIRSQLILKNIDNQIHSQNYDRAKTMIVQASFCISTLEAYYITKAEIFLLEKDYKAAALNYKMAIDYAPLPSIIMHKAYCETMLGDNNRAIDDLNFAANIEPILFQPHYDLMMLYLRNKDIKRAKEKAKYIVKKRIKIPSKQIDYYKQQANKVLKFNIQIK